MFILRPCSILKTHFRMPGSLAFILYLYTALFALVTKSHWVRQIPYSILLQVLNALLMSLLPAINDSKKNGVEATLNFTFIPSLTAVCCSAMNGGCDACVGGGGDPALCAVTFDRRAGEWRGAAEEGVALAYLFTRPHVVREAPDATGSVSHAFHARVSESASQVP